MGTAYFGVIDCVEQIRLADAEAVREAWMSAMVVVVMAIVLCAAACSIYHGIRKNVRSRLTRAALVIFALVATAWGGTKAVMEKGIDLTKCEVDAQKVVLEWSTTDERIKPGSKFVVQALREGGGAYETVATTTASNAVVPRFTVDKTHTWRIMVDAGEMQSEEGGTE